MAVKGDRDTVVIEDGVPFGHERRTMPGQRAKDRIIKPGDPNAAELHEPGTREHLAAPGVCVANADDVFHDVSLFVAEIKVDRIHPNSQKSGT